MHISKKQSLIIAIGTLVLFFVVSIFGFKSRPSPRSNPQRLASSSTPTPSAAVTQPDSEIAQEVSRFTLKEFHRSEVRDGKKLWEIYGTEGSVVASANAVRIRDAKLSLYRPDGSQIDIKADEATVALENATISSADLIGRVEIQKSKEYTLTTERLIYTKKTEQISAPGRVDIHGPLIHVAGEILEGDLSTNTFKLKKNVTSKILPGAKQ
jgi:LPS export ABC transporter protein LptC